MAGTLHVGPLLGFPPPRKHFKCSAAALALRCSKKGVSWGNVAKHAPVSALNQLIKALNQRTDQSFNQKAATRQLLRRTLNQPVCGIHAGLIKAADQENSASSGGSQQRHPRLLCKQGSRSNSSTNHNKPQRSKLNHGENSGAFWWSKEALNCQQTGLGWSATLLLHQTCEHVHKNLPVSAKLK
jgi:hypothetical protein